MKRGGKKSIKINISNRLLYTLIVIGILAVISVGVYAYGTSSPSAFGHSIGEIAPPSSCSSGQFLQWDGSAWKCAAQSTVSFTSGGAYGKGGITFGKQSLNSNDGWLYVGDQSGTVYGGQGVAAGNLWAESTLYANKICLPASNGQCITSWPSPTMHCPSNWVLANLGSGRSYLCVAGKYGPVAWGEAEQICAANLIPTNGYVLDPHLCSWGEVEKLASAGYATCGADGSSDEIWTSQTTNNNAAYTAITGSGQCTAIAWESWSSNRNYYCCATPAIY